MNNITLDHFNIEKDMRNENKYILINTTLGYCWDF